MKAEDLMIGDWVAITEPDDYHGYNGRVEIVNKVTQYVTVFVPSTTHDVLSDDLQPIPLTDEILEKNSFKKEEHDAIIITLKTYSLDGGDNGIVLFVKPKGGYKAMCGDMKKISQNELFFGDGSLLCMNCNTVHELQHILRLWKINKEITLGEE